MAAIIARRGDKGAKVKVIQRLLKIYPDGGFGPLTEEAVREFQRKNHISPDGVVGLRTWQELFGSMILPSKREITDIIIHCTATREGLDFSIGQIRKWHQQRGFSDIGYHYIIHRNGSVEDGRSVDIAGAHCAGHNTHSIGVCYIGGVRKDGHTAEDTRTVPQKEALVALLKALKKSFPNAKIRGHRDFANKDCPSFDATKEYLFLSDNQ